MTLKSDIQLTSFTDSISNSYSLVFFSKSKVFAFLILLVTFFDFYAGLSGLIAVLISNLAAYAIGFNQSNIRNGFYGFNSLLVALGLGIFYEFTGKDPQTFYAILMAITGFLVIFLLQTTFSRVRNENPEQVN